MQLGRFTIEQLSEGQFELFSDGKINRTPISETEKNPALDQIKETFVGINPLYVTDNKHHILLDAGLGWGLDAGSPAADISNICTNLDIFDIGPSDITHVILTHLHYDHAAGISYTDKNTTTRPTFPNATCLVQKQEWDFAVSQVQHDSPTGKLYNLDDLYRLYADNFFELLEYDENEIIPGLSLIKTGGHTAGHQVVKIADEGQTAYFLGDLIPTADQLNHFDVGNHDMNRILTKKTKVNLLRKAYQEKAFLFFYHSVHSAIGRLDRDEDKNYVLKEIE